MSYILDALKKAEQEKLRKSEPGSMSSITGDLFQDRSRQSGETARWKLVALVALVALIASAGTWIAVRGKKTEGVHSRSGEVPQPVAVAGSTSVTQVLPNQEPSPVIVPVEAKAVKTVAEPVTENKVVNKSRPDSSARKNTLQVKHPEQLPVSGLPVQTIQAPADVKVSGIAWQDDHSARRAVINGFLVREGGVVAGARVAEIMTDRVRFISSSGKFEIRLDNASSTEGRR